MIIPEIQTDCRKHHLLKVLYVAHSTIFIDTLLIEEKKWWICSRLCLLNNHENIQQMSDSIGTQVTPEKPHLFQLAFPKTFPGFHSTIIIMVYAADHHGDNSRTTARLFLLSNSWKDSTFLSHAMYTISHATSINANVMVNFPRLCRRSSWRRLPTVSYGHRTQCLVFHAAKQQKQITS